jgi:hypothetical protein
MIEKIIILSLISIGICATTWTDMIFDKPARIIEVIIGEFWAKPIFGCFICATFWWSIVSCLILGWPIYLALPAMGFSAVISMLQND